jgi:hypothetical protein
MFFCLFLGFFFLLLKVLLIFLPNQYIIVDWCCMCKKSEKTRLPFTSQGVCYGFRNFVFGLFVLEWVMPRQVVDLYARWRGHFVSF